MAKFNTGQSFADGDQVTGAKLNNIIGLLDIYSGVIADQASIAATVSTADLLLIADTDAGSSGAANKVTIQKLLNDTLTGGTFTNANIAEQLTYGTATGNRTVSTSAVITNGTITNGTITNGVIPVGTFGTTTSTAATITSGTITTGLIPNLTAGTTTGTAGIFTNGTIGTFNSTTGTIGTINSTTGTIQNLSATTSTFLGTITGSTNVINIGSGQIYKSENGAVGIGTISPRSIIEASGVVASSGSSGGFQLYDRGVNSSSIIIYSPQAADFRIFDVATSSDRFKVDTNGDCLVVSNARIGYGAGSGGTATQGTSKTTGVTLNKPTGQITMHNASLGNGASVNFALTNSFISAVDTLSVNATAFGGYTVQCTNTATGAATIRVTNISGGSLSEAVTIQFSIIKGSAT